MKHTSVFVIFISNVLITLDSCAWAQFISVPRQKLTITFDSSIPESQSINGTQYVDHLKQKFNLTQIRFLDLLHLQKKDADLFENSGLSAFSELTDLTISSSNIDALPEQALKGLGKLKQLNISSSGLQEIPADLVHHTPALQELILSQNKFTKLPAYMFQNISSLFNLDLHSNQLVSLHRNIFFRLKTLYLLFLNNNSLTSLDEDVFHDLGSRLTILDLSFNQISSVGDQIFAELKKLNSLLLVQAFSARVNTLPSKIFSQLANLEVIKLDRNNLEYLPEDIFQQNPKLETLSLAHNKLLFLRNTTFQNNTKLQSLYLNDNKLLFLNESVFDNLVELRELHLENNQILWLHQSIFSQLTNLKTIWISNNSVDMTGPHSNISNLYNCPNIENIYANNNSITQIFDDWIQKDGKLNVIDLRSNPIAENTIEPSRFRSDHVSIYLTDHDVAQVKLKKMTLLELDSNADRKIIMDKNPACGSNCACVIDIEYERHRMVLKCVRFDEKELLENIPPHLVKFSASLNVELRLSKCNLTSLYPVRGWLQQLNVTKLSLSNNHLSHLDGLPELPRLKVLELHNNEFTSFDRKTLGILQRASKLRMVTLHNNPWICECSSRTFFDFVLRHKCFGGKPPNLELHKHEDGGSSSLNKQSLIEAKALKNTGTGSYYHKKDPVVSHTTPFEFECVIPQRTRRRHI
ncbi:hypothetical protein V9T40_011016 [Parthenolecanium corni]|uniref:Uncharacterized protein n=1 Tax=Parthenolecanium corni TaxID=536013 RepID=A0AAN9T592_9HEMI